MTVTCNYRSTAVIILPGVYLPPQRNATVADDAFSLLFISIHAPREGSDAVIVYFLSFLSNFNPRSPRGERPDAPQRHNRTARFQSTPPARGATTSTCFLSLIWIISIHAPREGSDAKYLELSQSCADFNPRSPRGERPLSTPICAWSPHISIHAPREGSDQGGIQQCRAESQFQSTLPARGATADTIPT